MRLLATGGGTGGHVYPALSILEALDPAAAHDVAWVGVENSIEESITAERGIPFYSVDTGALLGANPIQAARSIMRLVRGTEQARRIVRHWHPDAVLATGGYVSVPLVMAAWLARCPVLIYLPDMTPGLAVKFLSRIARRIAVSVPSAADYFAKDKVIVSGYPVRRSLYLVERSDAHATLGLADALPVILVIGGSRGARSLNEAILAELDNYLACAQIIHICGSLDYERLAAHRAELTDVAQERYHLHAYLDQEMPDALAAADLVVARSGASVIGELPAVGVPAILVPYPYAGQHQVANARYLADSGAAILLEDATLGESLWPQVQSLLGAPERRSAMRSASKTLAMPQAAATIANELLELAGEGGNR